MKTLKLTDLDLYPLQACEESMRIEIIGALVEYYFNDTIHQFNDPQTELVFSVVLSSFQLKKTKSNARLKEARKKTKSKQNQNRTKTNQKQNENKIKTVLAEAQGVTEENGKINEKTSDKENEKIEEKEKVSPITPLQEDKEDRKDKEKKEIYIYKENLSEEEIEIEFRKRMKERYPRVMSMKQPLTYAQYRRLRDERSYSKELIQDILLDMENFNNLHKYVSANLTIQQWIKIKQRR